MDDIDLHSNMCYRWRISKLLPEAVFSPFFILLPVPKVDVCGDEDAEEGGGVNHLTLNLGHPPPK